MRRASATVSLLTGLGLVVATASLAVAGTSGPIVEPVAPVLEPVAPALESVLEPVEPVVEPVLQPVAPVVERVVEPVLEPVKPVVEPVLEPVAPVVEPVVEPVLEPVTTARLSSTTNQRPGTALSSAATLQRAATAPQPAGSTGEARSPATSPQQQLPQQPSTGFTGSLLAPDGGWVGTEPVHARGPALQKNRAAPEVIDLCILIPGSGSEPPRVEPLGEYPLDELLALGLVIEDPLVDCETVVAGVQLGPPEPLSLTDALARTGTAAGTIMATGALLLGIGTRLRLVAARCRVLH